ncbi:hypothetical protein GXP71_00085 [Cellulomonas sp. H30R-01]|uniref:hypothetical protein n=1 Tax=Cellulomonas sp. H30R-01 TaxID=2704467 RepID=UPI00138C86F6|nr:hypothetical protein [Cellulomonas sp. H30R-01]QHT54654.1 hypothetical protein GXP71_00085 [Cellulomonas sp. H30R-01]
MTLVVAASLWSTPPDRLAGEAVRLAAAGLTRWHWDVSDGVFAAPGGFDPDTVSRLSHLTGLPGEAHLMVCDPLAEVDAWTAVCDTVIVHVEATGWATAVSRVRSAGRRAGVAISPSTPLSALDDLPPDVAVLVMSITPGQAGSTFQPSTLSRLDALGGRAGGGGLGVDGGVTLDHAHDCAAHGATWVVSGSALCGASDPETWLTRARSAPGDVALRSR